MRDEVAIDVHGVCALPLGMEREADVSEQV